MKRKSKGGNKFPVLFFWLAVWEAVALIAGNAVLVASPAETFREFLRFLGESSFYFSMGKSILRIGGGFAAGLFCAAFLAFLAYRIPFVESLFTPFMRFLLAVPVASFAVLLLIWWGASFLSAAVSFLVVLPQFYVSFTEGMKSLDKKMLQMAEVYRLPGFSRFFYVYRPALKPFLYSSMKISLGMCWKSGVAAEVIGLPDFSIGEGLYFSKITLNTAGVFAWTGVIILLSLLFEKLMLKGTERFLNWEPEVKKPGNAFGGRREGKAGRKQEPGRGKTTGKERESGREKITGKEREAGREKITGKERESGREKITGKEREPGSEKAAEGEQRSGETKAAGKAGTEEIRVQGLCKAYGETQVFQNFSAVYEKGRIYYLRQPSGSGKTTLLSILAGIEKADAGSIRVPERVSMLFQEDRLCEEYDGVKNVELVCGNRKQASEALLKLLEPESLEKPCGSLSGGMKRRVALVRAMEAEADFVLLDEPFGGMDRENRGRAEQYIQERQQGRTILIATHI